MTVYNSNIPIVLESVADILAAIRNTDELLRKSASAMVPLIRIRVHVDGNDSNNQPIGVYEDGYLKVRQGKKYNRTADSKVILSLTRQMENDLSVIALNGGYGIGYKNNFNFDKSQWLEEKYDKEIFSLSKEELRGVEELIIEHTSNAIN